MENGKPIQDNNKMRKRALNFLFYLLMPEWLIEGISRLAGWVRGIRKDKSSLYAEARIRAILLNIKYGWHASDIGRHVILDLPSKITLHHGVSLHHGVKILSGPKGFCVVGKNTHISHNSVLASGGGLQIGKNCALSSGLAIYTATNERIEGLALPDTPIKIAHVQIEKEVLIGANVTILPGISINEGSVIGAGSVVTRNVAPSAVVAGSPAKQLRVLK